MKMLELTNPNCKERQRRRRRLLGKATSLQTLVVNVPICAKSISDLLQLNIIVALFFAVLCLSRASATRLKLVEIEHVHHGHMFGTTWTKEEAKRILADSSSDVIYISGTTSLQNTSRTAWGDNDDFSIENDNENNTEQTEKHQGTDIYIAKLTRSGQLEWVRRIGTHGDDKLGDLALSTNGDGSVYLCGETGFGDVFIAKVTKSGTWAWKRPYLLVSSGRDVCTAIDVQGNDVYVGGFTTGGLFARESQKLATSQDSAEEVKDAFIAHLYDESDSNDNDKEKSLKLIRGRQRSGYGHASVNHLKVSNGSVFYISSIMHRGKVTAYLNIAEAYSVMLQRLHVISVPSPSSSIKPNSAFRSLSSEVRGGFSVTGLHVSKSLGCLYVVGVDLLDGSIIALKYVGDSDIPVWHALIGVHKQRQIHQMNTGSFLWYGDFSRLGRRSDSNSGEERKRTERITRLNLDDSDDLNGDDVLKSDPRLAVDDTQKQRVYVANVPLPQSKSSLSSSSSSHLSSSPSELSPNGMFTLDARTGEVLEVWTRYENESRGDAILHISVDDSIGSVLFCGRRMDNAWVGAFGDVILTSAVNDTYVVAQPSDPAKNNPEFQNLIARELDSNRSATVVFVTYVCILTVVLVVVGLICCLCERCATRCAQRDGTTGMEEQVWDVGSDEIEKAESAMKQEIGKKRLRSHRARERERKRSVAVDTWVDYSAESP